MLSTAKPVALLPVLLAASAFVSTIATAQQAPPDRCTGTFCDLYYGGAPSDAPAPTTGPAPTPAPVPQGGILGFFAPSAPAAPGAPAAPTSRAQVQGGGLVGTMTGAPAQRCTGTLCDYYYGSSLLSFDSPDAGTAPAPAATPTAADAAPTLASDDEPTQQTTRHAVELRETHEPALCAASGRDPWSCYRR